MEGANDTAIPAQTYELPSFITPGEDTIHIKTTGGRFKLNIFLLAHNYCFTSHSFIISSSLLQFWIKLALIFTLCANVLDLHLKLIFTSSHQLSSLSLLRGLSSIVSSLFWLMNKVKVCPACQFSRARLLKASDLPPCYRPKLTVNGALSLALQSTTKCAPLAARCSKWSARCTAKVFCPTTSYHQV